MNISQKELRSIVREAITDASGKEQLSGAKTYADAAAMIGGWKSKTGTKRIDIHGPKITKYVMSSDKLRRTAAETLFFPGTKALSTSLSGDPFVNWAVGVLFKNKAFTAGPQSGPDPMATSRWRPEYTGYVYFLPGNRSFMQIDNVQPAQRSQIYELHSKAIMEPELMDSLMAVGGDAAPEAAPSLPTSFGGKKETGTETAPQTRVGSASLDAAAQEKINKVAARVRTQEKAFYKGLLNKAVQGTIRGTEASLLRDLIKDMKTWKSEEFRALRDML